MCIFSSHSMPLTGRQTDRPLFNQPSFHLCVHSGNCLSVSCFVPGTYIYRKCAHSFVLSGPPKKSKSAHILNFDASLKRKLVLLDIPSTVCLLYYIHTTMLYLLSRGCVIGVLGPKRRECIFFWFSVILIQFCSGRLSER